MKGNEVCCSEFEGKEEVLEMLKLMKRILQEFEVS